ncbi:hypothetical protein GCM10023347_49540 [Streptomyces chumphonensis]
MHLPKPLYGVRVSSSGLIYAVIVGAWAAYLVPMWLRRQDELNDARPTERFSTAIRMLTGRASAERRQAKEDGERSEPPAPEEPDGTADRPPADPASARPGALHPEERAVRAKVLARRRRTTMVLFLALTLGSVTAAVGGLHLLWAPAVPAGLLTAYILYVRAQERRRYAVRLASARVDRHRAEDAARRLRARRRPTGPDPAAAPTPEQPHTAPSPADDRRALVEATDHAEWVDQQRAPRALHDADGWEPVPVPLPTYVNAPVAPRHASGVDLEAPDAWSSARATEPASASAPSSTEDRRRGRTPLFDQYADQERRRAANE